MATPLQSQLFPTILVLALRHYACSSFRDVYALCEQVLQHKKQESAFLHLKTLSALRLGMLEQAHEAVRCLLRCDEKNPAAWNLQGELYRTQGAYDEAMRCFTQATTINPLFVDALCNQGIIHEARSEYVLARACYDEVLQKMPSHHIALFNSGNVSVKLHDYERAVSQYQQAYALQQHNPELINNYALVLNKIGKRAESLALFEKLLAQWPRHETARAGYAQVVLDSGNAEKASVIMEEQRNLKQGHLSDNDNMVVAAIYRAQGRKDEAISMYSSIVDRQPHHRDALRLLGNIHLECHNHRAAKDVIDRLCALYSHDLGFLFSRVMLELPIVYERYDDCSIARRRYTQGLEELKNHLSKKTFSSLQELEELVGSSQPFYLPYQGDSVVELQSLYGKMICEVMGKHYNPLIDSIRHNKHVSISKSKKIRVGIISGFFRNHSNYKIPIHGWISQCNKSEFELFGYHVQEKIDSCTQEASRTLDHFYQGPKSLREWIERVVHDNLDVIIYPEIGMDPMVAKLASLRLAPVQVNSWGHPVTSGMPTIDYFLSSDLMEPPHAQREYTEQLIRLPNLSIYYEPPLRTLLSKKRSDYDLSDDAVVYWCCQVIYKLLPQYDDIYPQIAQRVPKAQFVFITIQSESEAAKIFKERINNAFVRHGLDPKQYVRFLCGLPPDEFSTVASLCDVALDSLGWSGCNSTLETLAQGVPVITHPGDYMRAKHTEAILTMMDCHELIARSQDAYVALAVQLGADGERRTQLRKKVLQNINKLYRDTSTVRILEQYLRSWAKK